MKKIIFLICVVATINLHGQIKVTNVGNVGIGNNSPSYKLDVSGTSRFSPGWVGLYIGWSTNNYCPAIYTDYNNYLWLGRSDRWLNHIWCYHIDYQTITKHSDKRLKENIESYSNVLPKIRKINTYTYNYNDNYFKDFTIEQKQKAQRKEFGFISQELNEIFPELVFQSDSGIMSIDYISMVPILTTAIKEQQNIIDAQSLKIKELDDRLTKIEGNSNSKGTLKSTPKTSTDTIQSNKSIEVTNNLTDLTNTFLYQNNPNLFSERTEIKYFINESVKTSLIMIFDMQGVLKKQIAINAKGIGSVIIEGSDLRAGMYIYTLVCDGQEIDTKRMILTE